MLMFLFLESARVPMHDSKLKIIIILLLFIFYSVHPLSETRCFSFLTSHLKQLSSDWLPFVIRHRWVGLLCFKCQHYGCPICMTQTCHKVFRQV